MTKPQIIAELTKLNVDFNPTAKVAELQALLAEHKLPEPVDESEESNEDEEADESEDTGPIPPKGDVEENEDEPEEESEPTGKVEVSYQNPLHGFTIRVFSLEVHGKNYAKLAKEFAQNNNGTIEN